MTEKLVSVIITSFNREKYVADAIESALGQTHANIEIVLVDDASTDTTSQITSSYGKKDERIKIITNETNQGVAKSLNRGIDAAAGEYLAILDADDAWADPKKLQKQIAFLESHGEYSLAGGGAIVRDASGKEISRYLLPEGDRDIKKHLLVDNCFVHSTVVFRKKDWKAAGGYDASLPVDWDWAWCLELGKIGKLYNFSEYFTYYLQWDGNISNLDAKKNLITRLMLLNRYKKQYPGHIKSFLLAWCAYFYSFLPFKKNLRPVLLKARNVFFGKSVIHEK
ncbi:MAG: glycosyltransferase family 2 protein [bacterium]|nr:glycosyltransferase family 2 protein [bacterium]